MTIVYICVLNSLGNMNINLSQKLRALHFIRIGVVMFFALFIFGMMFNFTPRESIWVNMSFAAVFLAIRTYELKLKNELFSSKTFYNALYYAIGFGMLLGTVYYLMD